MGDDGVRLGIDFGTSHTVAVLASADREPRPILFEGSPLLPSAVCVDPTGRLLVGKDALHMALSMPAGFEPFPKRRIDDGTVLLGDRDVPVPDLIAAVLDHVRAEAKRVAPAPITATTLTCPAAWGPQRRELLLEVARRSLPSVSLVAEPVAAASFFAGTAGQALAVGQCAVVYDFGGGTFDASVVRRLASGFETIATEGRADCGGLDVDAAIVAHLGDTVGRRDTAAWDRLTNPADVADRRASRQLWDNVRAGKEMLSRATTTLVHVPLIDLDVPLGREELDALAAPILANTIEATRAVVAAAGIADREIGAVYLAGGSSRMPAVSTALHREFGIAPTLVDQPELVVAEGSLGATAAAVRESTPPVTRVLAPLRRSRRVALWSGLAVAVVLLAGVALIPVIRGSGTGRAAGPGAGATSPANMPAATSPSSTPSAPSSSPSTVDPCVVGRWRTTSSTLTNLIDGVPIQFNGGAGIVATYRADGTVTVNFNASQARTATVKGQAWKFVTRGTATANVLHADGNEQLSGVKAKGSYVYYQDGRRNSSGPLDLSIKQVRYRCSGNSLRIYGDAVEEWVRIG